VDFCLLCLHLYSQQFYPLLLLVKKNNLMEHARKFVLLSHDNVRRIQQLLGKDGTFKTVQTPGTAKERLDAQMNDILNSTDDRKKDDREKWNDYHRALQKFLLLSSNADDGSIALPFNASPGRYREQSKDEKKNQTRR